jgi:3-phosphoshikimate 1-carboxyvinyltransferase
MVAALRQLGAQIDDHDPAHWTVQPLAEVQPGQTIDCGLAGTVMRFLPPLAAAAPGPTRFEGDRAAADRPLAGLLDGLRQLGAAADSDRLPFRLTGPVVGGRAVIDASRSSQFVSGLLLSGASWPRGLDLGHRGGPIPSRPHIAMTVQALADRGVAVAQPDPSTWRIAPGPIQGRVEVIEPDLTTAAVFLAAALVAGGSVTVPDWPARSNQPGWAAPAVLSRFGGSWSLTPEGLTMTGDGRLSGVDLDLADHSELICVAAGLACLAATPSRIRGVGHVRGHETDRLAALTSQLSGLGADCQETADGLAIRPARLRGGLFRTFGDHRLAHAAALVGLRQDGVELDDVAVVSKTMPDFAAVWQGLLL